MLTRGSQSLGAVTTLREQALSLLSLPKNESEEGILAHYHVVSCLKPLQMTQPESLFAVQHAWPTLFTGLKYCKCRTLPHDSSRFFLHADEAVLKSLNQAQTHCTLFISCQRTTPNL